MTIAHVVTTKASGSAGGTSPSVDTSGANFLVIMASYQVSSGPTISDSKGNTWTPLTEQTNSTTPAGRMYYVTNPTVGSGHTFTISGGSTFSSIVASAFSGVDTSSPFDQQSGTGGAGQSDSVPPGSLTPATNDYVIIEGAAAGNPTTTPTCSGFTLAGHNVFVGGTSYASSLFYQIQTTATARNVVINYSVGGWGGGQIIQTSFKVGAAVAATVPNNLFVRPVYAVHRSTLN